MRKRDLGKPAAEITFHCAPCRLTFKAAPARIEDDPVEAHHPYAYFAECPKCRMEADQAPWERALIKAWANATGPKTPEGLAATAKNLEGHPTAEEAHRTRFNALKHGLNARTAQYFPARPDGYDFCKACDVSRDWCGKQVACVRKTELFMLHHAAFDQRKPEHLKGIYSDLQGAVFAMAQEMIRVILADGVKLQTPQWYSHEGIMYLAEHIDDQGEKTRVFDIEAHPLLKPLLELLSRNNLSLADMGMTTKVIEQEQEELGRLESQDKSRTLIGDFMRQQAEGLRTLQGLVEKATAARDRDPILIEYRQQNDS